MHLLDLILVLVLLPCINASLSSFNNSCGYVEVETPSLLFYGRNVTITFRPVNDTNASPKLIDSFNRNLTYKHHHHDNESNVFTFILPQNSTAERHQHYFVKYDECYSDFIILELQDPPTLGPRKNIEGCHGCLIASIGEKTDAFRNDEPVISCSLSKPISWTVFITINNKTLRALSYSEGKFTVHHTVQAVDHMTTVVCSMTIGDLTLNDTAILYAQDPPTLGPRKNIEGCHGCLIASIGEKTDAFRNDEPVISCSLSKPISWTVFITINNKTLRALSYSEGKFTVHHTVQAVDHMTTVVCSMTIGDLTLNDTAILYAQDTPSVQINTPDHTFVPEGSSNEVTCLVDSRAPPNITWFYMQDGGQITKTCNVVTQCSVLVSGLQKGETRTYVCTVETDGRKLSISFLAEGTADSAVLWVTTTLGSGLLLVGVITACVCRRRRLNKKTLSTDQNNQQQPSNVPQERHDDITERGVAKMNKPLHMTETHLYTGMRESISMSKDPSYAYDRISERDAPAETHFAVVEKQDHSGQGVIRSAVAKKLGNEGQGETNYENYEVELFENDGRGVVHTKSDTNVYSYVAK